jgi:hypothetical protein
MASVGPQQDSSRGHACGPSVGVGATGSGSGGGTVVGSTMAVGISRGAEAEGAPEKSETCTTKSEIATFLVH